MEFIFLSLLLVRQQHFIYMLPRHFSFLYFFSVYNPSLTAIYSFLSFSIFFIFYFSPLYFFIFIFSPLCFFLFIFSDPYFHFFSPTFFDPTFLHFLPHSHCWWRSRCGFLLYGKSRLTIPRYKLFC